MSIILVKMFRLCERKLDYNSEQSSRIPSGWVELNSKGTGKQLNTVNTSDKNDRRLRFGYVFNVVWVVPTHLRVIYGHQIRFTPTHLRPFIEIGYLSSTHLHIYIQKWKSELHYAMPTHLHPNMEMRYLLATQS